MKKDFDQWNNNKKITNNRKDILLYSIREIRWCRLGVNIGFEQDGTGKSYSRPVLILKGFSRYVCSVVPLTTSCKNSSYHFFLGEINDRKSFAIISQIRLIDTRRLDQKIAVLNKDLFEQTKKAIREMI